MNYNNMLAQKIYGMLEPLIGATMAQATLKVQSNKLGVPEDSFSVSHLPQLSQNIEKGLVVFLGSETARRVSQRIERMV